ncbi:hypothetical protein H2200_004346 [Cladophialophora chaetospira]|uniref:NADH:flavin oxidoreductase/NADH oxidase N-terminal domain-containing protein n=1 Tax=Cladophialophora chaetospira TaxID=386627 RepID=A0AA39CK36_9EURO|nr:hypothetical protein H2200_004346 [Cladophialophora chaetospira]
MSSATTPSIEVLSRPLTLPCGLTLPNRLVKCPMQETCAEPPYFDPPVEKFRMLYKTWGTADYGMLLTGQVQVDLRYFSIAGDVCTRPESLLEPTLSKWKAWAETAAGGTPVIVQLAHPGRMSPAGAGVRPPEMRALCPSAVPVKMGNGFLDKLALEKLLGTPKEMTLADIDEAVQHFVTGTKVAREAGFSGVQIHGAHGFLVSQFLSPYTNRRTDEYGGTPEKRLAFLQRLVREMRAEGPPPFALGVKLNSGDYMDAAAGGLSTDEALEQVRWLVACGMVDFVEVSGGNAESTTDKLRGSFGSRSLGTAPKRESTRLREACYTEFAERIMGLKSKVPIQLSGGFRSRNGMADAVDSGLCDLVGLGRSAVLEPRLPKEILLNPEIPDDEALAMSHQIRGLWLGNWIPAKVVGSGLGIQFFYWNMRRLASGLASDPYASVPYVVFSNSLEIGKETFNGIGRRVLQYMRNMVAWQDVKGD